VVLDGLTDEEVDQLLDELPTGHSASPGARRLYIRLTEARRERPAVMQLALPQDLVYGPAMPALPAPTALPRRFHAVRTHDPRADLGVGVYAEGCMFSDGAVVQRLLGSGPLERPGWSFHDEPGTEVIEQDPGIQIVWLDQPDS
jgi:hypothetical protein